MEKEQISIIIPVYNVEIYIRKCLESVVKQTYQNLQIIVVDDGSTDTSGEICNQYAGNDKRIKVIHQENAGLSEARNAGMRQATGDYIMFLDSDDWVAEDICTYLAKPLQRHQAEIAICGWYRVTKEKSKAEHAREDMNLSRQQALEALCRDQKIKNFAWGKMYRREILDGITFPSGKKFEDIATTYQAVERAEHVMLLQKPKYYYMQRSNSISRCGNILNSIDRCTGHQQRYEDLVQRHPELEEELLVQYFYALRLLMLDITKSKEHESKYQPEMTETFTFFSNIEARLMKCQRLLPVEKQEIRYIMNHKGSQLKHLEIIRKIQKKVRRTIKWINE